MTSTKNLNNRIAFQGQLGANSHVACKLYFPAMEYIPCNNFEDAFNAVKYNDAKYAMIPIENSVMGRVADIHNLLPESGLFIIGEYFHRVVHHLMAIKDSSLKDIKTVMSQLPALSQCKKFIKKNNFNEISAADTAGSAKEVFSLGDKSIGAIASSLASEIYNLKIIASNIEDADHNTTRFIVMANKAEAPELKEKKVITSIIFKIRNVPAALYKGLGGFATNGVNITKLESYIIDGNFTAAQFYADFEGHQELRHVKLALEELSFYSKELKILGCYKSDPYRSENNKL